ncbi:hypothetical protein CEXT_670231 [Caerostris extrusa]|uniref:Uncharacterized protein n=1 Tax=Caerostris extrusa TaxID=172846 RepID=A0AAV4P4K9_CAEEX|nr:hypothetical protein CEXT_670231 [Caerostris extrusa]
MVKGLVNRPYKELNLSLFNGSLRLSMIGERKANLSNKNHIEAPLTVLKNICYFYHAFIDGHSSENTLITLKCYHSFEQTLMTHLCLIRRSPLYFINSVERLYSLRIYHALFCK